MKFLFWNIQNKDLLEEVTELIVEEDCDIFAVAETDDALIEKVVEKLRIEYNAGYYSYSTPGCERIKIIAKFPIANMSLLNQHKYFSLIKVESGENAIIVGFVHLPSKYSHTLDIIRSISELLGNQLILEEDAHSITESILIGDFNTDPFEMPMISFSGISATNGIDCSNRGTVTRTGLKSKLFYNPMWTLYSKYKERPGSHRYIRLGEDVVSWHFLDQVIIRPTLVDDFNFESLRLIFETTNYNYLNINKAPKLSDHLPLTCEINF